MTDVDRMVSLMDVGLMHAQFLRDLGQRRGVAVLQQLLKPVEPPAVGNTVWFRLDIGRN